MAKSFGTVTLRSTRSLTRLREIGSLGICHLLRLIFLFFGGTSEYKYLYSGGITATKALTHDVSSVKCAKDGIAFDLPPVSKDLA